MKIDRTPFFVSIFLLVFGFGFLSLPFFTTIVANLEGNFYAVLFLFSGFFGLGQCSVPKRRRYYFLSKFNEGTKFEFIRCIKENLSDVLVIFITDDVDSYNVLIERQMYDRIKNKKDEELFLIKGDLVSINRITRQNV